MTVITRDEYLEVNSVPLSTPAWWITNLTPEMLSGPDMKGRDMDVPHAVGVYPNPRRVTVTVKQFQMVIVGTADKDGGTPANYRVGVLANIEYLRSNLGIGLSTGDGTVPAIWHRWDATTTSADVHVTGFHVAALNQRAVNAVLELSIPGGVFS